MFTTSKLVSKPNLLMAIVIAVFILCIFLIYLEMKKHRKVSSPDHEGFAAPNKAAVDAANKMGSYAAVKVYYDQIYQDAKSCDPKLKNEALMRGYGVSSDMKNPINTAGINCSGQNDTGINSGGGGANSADKKALNAANNNVQNLQNAVEKATSNYLVAVAAAKKSGSANDKEAEEMANQEVKSAQAILDAAEKAAKALSDKNAIAIAIANACNGQPPSPCKELAAASAAAAIANGLSPEEVNLATAAALKSFQDSKNSQETQTIQISQNQGMQGYDRNDNNAPSLGRGKSKCDMKPQICGRNRGGSGSSGYGSGGGAGGAASLMGFGDGSSIKGGFGDDADNIMNNLKKVSIPSANAPSPALLAEMMKAGIPVALSSNDANVLTPMVDQIANNKMPKFITPDAMAPMEFPASDILLMSKKQLANVPLKVLESLPPNILKELPSNILAKLPQEVLDKLPSTCKANCVIPPRMKIPPPPPRPPPPPAKVFDTKCEGESGVFSCPSGQKITGIKVKYGKWNKGSCPGPNSNTETVKFVEKVFQPAACVGKLKCTLPINDTVCGNPVENTRKEWIASAVCEKMVFNTKCEDDVGTFKCDGAQIMTGINLKYGKWNQGSCIGANSDTDTVKFTEKIVQPPECIAKQSCTIKIGNSVGGDPFGGTRKEWVASPVCSNPPPPPIPPCVCGHDNYKCHKFQDHGGDDIKCYSGTETPESCAAKCEADYDCLGYNVWTPLGRKGCCLKTKSNITGKNDTADFCAVIKKPARPIPPGPPPPPGTKPYTGPKIRGPGVVNNNRAFIIENGGWGNYVQPFYAAVKAAMPGNWESFSYANMPADMTKYATVWDTCFGTPLPQNIQKIYQYYLYAGGAIFIHGEWNTAWKARDDSIAQFVSFMGGGTVVSKAGAILQGAVTFKKEYQYTPGIAPYKVGASGEFSSTGTGNSMFNESANGAVWKRGTMSVAPEGCLVAYLDINIIGGWPTDPKVIKNLGDILFNA